MKNVDSLYSESTQLRSSDEYDSSIKSPEDRKTLNMEDIHAKSALTSSMFSAMFGQQNNDLVRTLRLREKNIVADVLGKAIKSQFCFYKNLSPEKLSEIKENGFVRIKNASSTINASEIRREFENKEGTAFHVWDDEKEKILAKNATGYPQCAFSPSDVLSNESLRNLFLSEEVLDLVEGYLGAPGRLFHVNAMCSFPSEKHGNAQTFHRDNSHPIFCVLFVYLSDVNADSGAHQYFKHTHDRSKFEEHYPELNSDDFFDLPKDSYGFDKLLESSLARSKETITGDAGTCFLSDPRGLHRGLPPKNQNRWLAWARYALIPDVDLIPKIQMTPKITENLTDRQLYCLSSLIESAS
jgi:hypothetical protein